MVKYDKYYQGADYFGNPYPDLVKLFKAYEPKGKVLDLGCGQGRDALALARLGYEVTGVDISSVGIQQMLQKAERENLEIKGLVGDIYEFEITAEYDIILLDSMFHFYKREKAQEKGLLEKIMKKMRINALLCIVVNKSKTTEPVLEKIFKDSPIKWEILVDKYVNYPEYNAQFRMYATKKKG